MPPSLSTSLESLLKTVATRDDDDDLAAAFSMYLPRALDSLNPNDARLLATAIDKTEKEYRYTKELLSKVHYDKMHRQLEDILAGMKDPQEWPAWRKEETRCLQKIYDWLSVLWSLGVESGRHRKLVRKCLLLCEDVVARMVPHPSNTGKRLPSQTLELVIKRFGGCPVFTPGDCLPRDALAWMWLNFLVGSKVQYSDAEAVFIEDTIAGLSPTTSRAVGRLFQDHVAPESKKRAGDLQYSSDEDSYVDIGYARGWKPDEKAVLVVRDRLYAPIIRTFRQSPTIDTFTTLVRNTPCIAPALLEVTRRKVRGNVRSRTLRIGWRSAAMIFCDCGTPSDITHLSETLAATPLDDDVLGALLAMAGHYKARFPVPGGSIVAEPLIMAESLFKAALQRTIGSCWLGIAQLYPGWDDAWDWLDEVVQGGTLSMQISPEATNKQKADRLFLIAIFKEMLRSGAIFDIDEDGPKPLITGRKRTLDDVAEAGAEEWDPARDVRKCLDALRNHCSITKHEIGASAVAKAALGSDYLASVEGVFNALHEIVPDQPVRKALLLLRDILRNEWRYPKRASLPSIESLDADVDAGERPAKRRRVPPKVPCGTPLP